MKTITTRVVAFIITVLMIVSIFPMAVFSVAAEGNSGEVIYENGKFGYNGYYNVISRKDYVLVPGAAVEYEMVLNNDANSRRQVLHVIEVDPSNPDVSIVPGYNQIDKLAEDPNNEANWSHKELTDMAKYYENNLGYNIVGGMNTDLYYDTYAPRILVYNGQDIGVKGKTSPSSSILYVFKDAEGNISCDVKAFDRAEYDSYLAEGVLLHAVSVSFGMVVKDGKLVKTTEVRESTGDAARSMVGIKADGTLVICMNDGRGANNSEGLSGEFEEGEAMLALGCQWAANCDGGGSSTFLTKRVGEESFEMRSVPCDGAQRPTAHGIFVASNVAPTGILNNVNITADYDIFAPKTEYTFGAEAIDTHGYAMDMPADASWALSDSSFGTIENGKFVSNGTKGTVAIQVISAGQVVGSKTITVADPAVFALSATSTVVPYSTADKVRTIALPIIAMTGEANVYVDTNAVSVELSNALAGTLNGFSFTATTDTSIKGVDVTIKYNDIVLTYAIEFGKGSEVIWDFEDGDKAGFMGFEEAKKWSLDNGVNNSLVLNSNEYLPGSKDPGPLAGQFNEYLSSTTFTTTAEQGGQVRNGNYALAWKLDNSDASFASWSYNILFNTNDVVVFRDVANGLKATTLGMWIYIPENAFSSGVQEGVSNTGKGLAFQSQFNSYANWAVDGKASCVQSHFMFTSAATGKSTNLNSATNADIPESRWVYASIDISGYDYLSTMPATNETNTRSPSFIRTYIKPDTAEEVTFYIDDITLDYSSAVDDRVLPTITAPSYSTSDTAVSLENGLIINGNKIAFSATVSDNAALDLTSGKISVDGIAVSAAINGSILSTKEDVALAAGIHTVAFEVKDELGNPMKVTRTFAVAGDAIVELSGHNYLNKLVEVEVEKEESEEGTEEEQKPETILVEVPDIKAQSIYYVDINVADLAQVTKLVAQIKLNNANKWETIGAVVANGFEATFAYNEISEILTVTVEMVNASKVKALDNTIVSIPVRVWTFDRYNYVTNTYYAAADMGNKPVVNIDVSIVCGEVTLADNTTASFGGEIHVATELTTISSPYHVHDAELTVLNKEASTLEAGYENRTYCETCCSVVDWGTIIPKVEITHNYVIVDGKFVCADEDCGLVYESGTGVFEMNGNLYYSLNGVLKNGWQDIDGKYCYAGSDYALYIGSKTVNGITYVFDENGITNGAWVTAADGKLKYSFGPGFYPYGWQVIDGETYFFGTKFDGGYAYTGLRSSPVNPNSLKAGIDWYEFAEDGKFIRKIEETCIVTDSLTNVTSYLINGETQMTGLTKIGEDYYYLSTTDGAMAIDVTRQVAYNRIDASAMDRFTTTGTYTFGADGKMIIEEEEEEEPAKKNGIIDGYYYVDDVMQKTGLTKVGDDYYYFSTTDGKMAVSVTRQIAYNRIDASAMDRFTKTGTYTFGADGKMIIEEEEEPAKKNGIIDGYYYINDVIQKTGLTKVGDDYYYFSTTDGKMAVSVTRQIAYNRIDVSAQDNFTKTGTYTFGADGKMIIEEGTIPAKKNGIIDGYYYVNDVIQKTGLTKVGDDYYYFSTTDGKMAVSVTRQVAYNRIDASAMDRFTTTGTYTFGADGKMILA